MQAPSQVAQNLGFFSYVYFDTKEDFNKAINKEKINALALGIIYSLGSLLSISISITFPWMIVIIPSLAITSLAIYHAIANFIHLSALYNLHYKNAQLKPEQSTKLTIQPKVGTFSKDEGLFHITSDAVESNLYKLAMIQSAKNNLILSGCYCGGEIFNEALRIIYKKIIENPSFCATILASNTFLDDENKALISEIESKTTKKQFHIICSEETFLDATADGKKSFLSFQHTKLLAIDDGFAFVIGGSGLSDGWFHQNGRSDMENTELYFHSFSKRLMPVKYQDADLISIGHSAGIVFYEEMEKLVQKMLHINNQQHLVSSHQRTFPQYEKTAFMKQILDCAQTFQYNLLLEKDFPTLPTFFTQQSLSMMPLASGSGSTEKTLENLLINEIDQTKQGSSIYIDHMYFHPSERLADAIAKACIRGVDITIITNFLQSSSTPFLHYLYTPLSKYALEKTFSHTNKPNLHIYFYNKENITNHKKLIVIDDIVITGSSNLSQGSLDHLHYEMDVVVKSAQMAKEAKEVMQKDITCSIPYSCNEQKTASFLQKAYANFIETFFVGSLL